MKSSLLYEQDILLWVEDTVAKLKARDFENLDLENLIEEVESLGISQKKELTSRLMVILEHLLKRLYVNSPYDFNGWERTIRTQRNDLELLLEDAPSSGGDKQAEVLMNKAFHPIDLQKDKRLLTGLLRMKLSYSVF
ncbi:MAG: DUF29 domain-containing protein [Symploca sp. SIO2E6]|nr:DUF29 domain-containing protein [Symploca sp. SIO2E6]